MIKTYLTNNLSQILVITSLKGLEIILSIIFMQSKITFAHPQFP